MNNIKLGFLKKKDRFIYNKKEYQCEKRNGNNEMLCVNVWTGQARLIELNTLVHVIYMGE